MPTNNQRPIDKMAQENYSWLGRSLVFIQKAKIKTWQAVFVIAFITGVSATLIWTISDNYHPYSSASIGPLNNTPVPPPSSITVLSPKGGEIWKINTMQNIIFKKDPTLHMTDLILVPICSPGDFTCPATGTREYRIMGTEDTTVSWKVGWTSGDAPNAISGSIPSGLYKMKICVTNTSNCGLGGQFTLSPAFPITALSPRGGEIYKVGNPVTLRWQFGGSSPVLIEIRPVSSPVTDVVISFPTPDTGSYTYSFPSSMLTRGTSWKMRVSDVYNRYNYGESDAFTVMSTSTPVITVLSPKGGEILQAGKIYPVRWTSSGIPQNANVNLSLVTTGTPPRDTGSWISPTTSNSGTYNFLVPANAGPGSGYRIIIHVLNNCGPENNCASFPDGTSGYFSIATTTPNITVLSPNLANTYLIGTTTTIRWSTTSSLVNKVVVDWFQDRNGDGNYETDWGLFGSMSQPSGPTGGSVVWTVPSSIFSMSSECARNKIKVTAYSADGAILATDWSDAPFRVASSTPSY